MSEGNRPGLPAGHQPQSSAHHLSRQGKLNHPDEIWRLSKEVPLSHLHLNAVCSPVSVKDVHAFKEALIFWCGTDVFH